MTDPIWAAFRSWSAALFAFGDQVLRIGERRMIELLFIYQLARKPAQAIARRWWCRALFRVSRGRRRCSDCSNS
jgi:hypothetical protein